MAPNFSSSHRTPFAAQIDEPVLVDDWSYILEPPQAKNIWRMWYSGALIPYSISDDTFAFMGPLPGFVKKSSPSYRFFPIYRGWEPVVSNDQPFDFTFLKNQLYFPPQLKAPDS